MQDEGELRCSGAFPRGILHTGKRRRPPLRFNSVEERRDDRGGGRMKRIGLTGGIGAGKSTVARIFADFGVPVIDVDALARVVVEPGSRGLTRVAEAFGTEVLRSDGTLDREALGKKIFAAPALRTRLEGILHPLIEQEMNRRIAALEQEGKHAMVLVDIPLLFEAGWESKVDCIVLVYASPEVQLERVRLRDGMPLEEARRRLAAQMPIQNKVARSHYVIRNDGSLEETRTRTMQVYRELLGLS